MIIPVKRWLTLIAIPAFSSAAVTPDDIQRDIKYFWPAEFSQKIPDADWNTTLTNISAGRADWIALAAQLAPVMDRPHAIQLGKALYDALLPNAEDTLAVLAILDKNQHTYPFQQRTGTSCVPPLNKSGDGLLDPQNYEQTRLALLDAGPQGADCLWTMEALAEEVKAVARSKANAKNKGNKSLW